MNIGKYFTLEEMVRTDTGFQNIPNTKGLINLSRLVALILDPLRQEIGTIRVTSGFRSQAVNANVGGVPTSFHTMGCAADIKSANFTPMEILEQVSWLALPFDKVICEFDSWVHIQIAKAGGTNRGQYLRANKVGGETQYSGVDI